MPRIEDLIGKKPRKMQATEDTLYIGGAFTCQTCNKVVDEAEMDRNTLIVSWVCSDGHESKVNL